MLFAPFQTIEYPTEGGRTAYMLYYPPASATFVGPADERPPLICKIHGGPTAAGALHELRIERSFHSLREQRPRSQTQTSHRSGSAAPYARVGG